MTTINNNSKFSSLSETQKHYVLATLANRAISNPAAYGLPHEGNLMVGDKVDINKLIGDRAELDKLIDKALRLPEAIILSISKNHQLIKEWLAAHPHETLDESKVAEILSGKKTSEIQKEPLAAKTPMTVGPRAEMNGLPSRAELESEVKEAKIHPIQSYHENQIQKRQIVGESVLPDKRSMMSDLFDHQKVEEALINDVDQVYGKSKMFGLAKLEGVKTSEWNFTKGIPAKKFMEFFTHNSGESDLNPQIREILGSVPQHRNMALHLDELMKHAGGKVVPYENENVEAFVKRLGRFIMSHGQTEN